MTEQQLWAARRCYNRNGTTNLVLVQPETGKRSEVSEELLKVNGIKLGDTLYASNLGSSGYSKTFPIGGFDVSVEGNVATMKRVTATLRETYGKKTFVHSIFKLILSRDRYYPLERGHYSVDITLLDEPFPLLNNTELHFEATNALRILPTQNALPTGNFTPHPVDPNPIVRSPFDVRSNLFAPIEPPPMSLPDVSYFENRRVFSPELSPDSPLHLPCVPGSPLDYAGRAENTTPVPKPRCKTPAAQSPSPNKSPAPAMKAENLRTLFAFRRVHNPDGAHLLLMDINNGRKFFEREDFLNSIGIGLGNFLTAKMGKRLLTEHTKIKKMETKLDGDNAWISNIAGTLIEYQGRQVFQTNDFALALYTGERLAPGKYHIKISLLSMPITFPDGKTLVFEGTNNCKIPWGVKPNIPKPIGKVHGAGFPAQNFGNQVPGPVVAPQGGVVFGAGFAKKQDEVFGAGFKDAASRFVKMRAVMIGEKDGVKMLWILDRQTEGRITNPKFNLQKGHFFEGSFEADADGIWILQEYHSAIGTPLFEGGLDKDGSIWFKVKIEKVKLANGNMKFSEATAKYIGTIVDTEGKLAVHSNGVFAKVKRVELGKNNFHWSVVEVL